MRLTAGERLLICLALVGLAHPAFCDEERANEAVVHSSNDGACYARSIPAGDEGDEGNTTVYWATDSNEIGVDHYPWYARSLTLHCGYRGSSIYLIRYGAWPRGHQASSSQLALGFYADGETVAEYSTLDIAVEPDNVLRSVSHYRVFQAIQGLTWCNQQTLFIATAADGRHLQFELAIGSMTELKDLSCLP